jgi:membrane protein DedA with SNARE-associated domain
VIEAFLARWGYLAVGFGTMVEGEAVLLAGGAFAHRGVLSLPLVIFAAFVGSVVSDQLWFHAGRHFGRRFIERRPALCRRERALEPWLRRYGNGVVFGFRFAYGMRTVTPVVLGATGYPGSRFFAFNVLGAALWAGVFGLAGWGLGASLARALARAGRAEEIAAAAVLVTLGLWGVHRLIAARAKRVFARGA